MDPVAQDLRDRAHSGIPPSYSSPSSRSSSKRGILTPNPYFYEFAALICLAVDVLVFSAVDLSASFYFMWALILVELSLALRRRWATIAAYLLMYAPLLFVAGELAARPDLGAYAKLISPNFLGMIGLSAISFPFFRLHRESAALLRRQGRRRLAGKPPSTFSSPPSRSRRSPSALP